MEKYKNSYGIYIILNKINGLTYVGQTKRNFKGRYWAHLSKLRKNMHENKNLQTDWNTYGEGNFTFIVKEVLVTSSLLIEHELNYINNYRKLNICYNIQYGGESYNKEESSYNKETKDKISNKKSGKKHSEETKRKMSECHKGKHWNKDAYILNEEDAFKIKTMLMSGLRPRAVSEEVGVRYSFVNSILSNNTWSHVYVEGWDEYISSRKRVSRLSIEECLKIYDIYLQGVYPQQNLADIYGKTRHTIANAIKRAREI